EAARQQRRCFMALHASPQKFFQRCGFARRYATRNDQVEIAQVGGDIVCKTMRRDPTADVHTDCADLLRSISFADPDSRLSRFAASGNAKLRGRANHGLFQHTHIPMDVAPNRIEIDDWIANNLARSVVSDVSASIRFEK